MTKRKLTAFELAEAWSHRYSCTCDLCREAWREVGPDPDTGLYGPFGKDIDQEEGENK